MDHMLYIAASGAKNTLLAQTANSHNLANVNTTGFRADLLGFRSDPIEGPGLPSRINGAVFAPGTDFGYGAINTTGRQLDIAVSGDGWIAVQGPDGNEAYTRAGDLRISSGGILQTGAGHPVLGNGGPIAIPPSESLDIGSDGTISIRPLGEAATSVVELDRIKLVNPELGLMEKREDGLIHLNADTPAVADANVRIVGGGLETSNVSAVDSLVNMIELSRQFEMQIRLMRVAQENDSADAQLLRLGS